MSFQSKLRNNQRALAATALTGVSGTTLPSNSLVVDQVEFGSTIAAEVTAVIQTTSVTLSPQVQVSQDASTWAALVSINNAAPVTITASGTKILAIPALLPFKYLRILGTVGGSTATAGDTMAVKWHYVQASGIVG